MDPLEDRSEIAFFDVETTMPNRGQRFAILEFGSILVCPKKLTELQSYTTLVQPSDLSLISSLSARCNGINRNDVVLAPTFSDIADTVYDILHGRVWAGHNILRFDCARIREAFAEIGRQPPEPKGAIDSLALLTQRFGRRAGDMKMATLATYFGLGEQTHRSLDDVRMNLEVLKYCATVLFLESSLPDVLVDNSVSPESNISSKRRLRASSSHEDPFNISVLRNEMTTENHIAFMEDEQVNVVSENTISQESLFLAPDAISLQNVKAVLVPFYHGSSQIMKVKLLHGDSPLQLRFSSLKIRFGINGKYLDNAGRKRLNFVVDLSPVLCSILEECDDKAQKLSVDSGSCSDWNPVVNPKKGFVNSANARIHIQTEVNGDVARYATEINHKDQSRANLVFNNPTAELFESFLTTGSVVDAFLSLEAYDYQQKAGIRLVAKKLVIH